MVRIGGVPDGVSARDQNETEEDYLARVQMAQAGVEEETKQKIEANRVKLRRRQLTEERYAVLNTRRINEKWRQIMRKAKVEELKKEIEVLSQNHERAVDRKDGIIQKLDRDLEEAEEQYRTSLRAQHQVVDSLIDLQYLRLKELEQEFLDSVRDLVSEFEAEKTEVTNVHQRNKKDISDIMAAMELEFQDAETESRHEFESQREEIKNRNSEEYQVLKLRLESIIEELERHFDQAHQAYLSSTNSRNEAFKTLTKSDATSARIIEKRMRKLMRMQDSLSHWRAKIASNSREWEERNKSLRAEKDILAKHYHNLKASLDRFRSSQAGKLKAICINSGNAITDLNTRLNLAEQILHLSELCRKLETESEKVLPFGGDAADKVDAFAAEVAAEAAKGEGAKGEPAGGAGDEAGSSSGDTVHMSSYGVDGEGKEIEEWDYLNCFFKRLNRVTVDNESIRREKLKLDASNKELRHVLKKYLDGISVNEDVINDPTNPLFVVNNKVHTQLKVQTEEEQLQQEQLKLIQQFV